MVGNFMSSQEMKVKTNSVILPSMGRVQEWCWICPAYVGMPHETNLGLQEFQQMMAVHAVAMKVFCHEYVVAKIQSQMDVVTIKLDANRCGHKKFPNKIDGNFLAT